MKRQKFLEPFLSVFGAEQICWTCMNENAIFGTVIYDNKEVDQRQDFVWYMREDDVPSDMVIELLEYLMNNSLIEIDKIKVPVAEIEIPCWDRETTCKLFDELFSVAVYMVDHGIETDIYVIHQ